MMIVAFLVIGFALTCYATLRGIDDMAKYDRACKDAMEQWKRECEAARLDGRSIPPPPIGAGNYVRR